MIRHYALALLLLCGCTKQDALRDIRFATGQAGALLNAYERVSEDRILMEARAAVALCPITATECQLTAIDVTIDRYRARERQYNELARTQNLAMDALAAATSTCRTDGPLCSDAQAKAASFAPLVLDLVQEVQSWR